jgi:F-type H+-transporting ATPase subunit b
MKKLLLPLALVFSFVASAETTPEGEHSGGAHKAERHEADHFCHHVAPNYQINWFDLFHYKHDNHVEMEKCMDSVLKLDEELHNAGKGGIVVAPGQEAHDGNKVVKPEINAGILDEESAIYSSVYKDGSIKTQIHRPKIVGPPYLFALVNFFVLLWVLIRFAKKPLQEFLHTRYDTIKQELEASTKRFTEAQARLAEYESRLKNMEDSRKALMQQYEEQAQREVQKLKEDAEKAIAKIKADTTREIENSLLNAEKTIRREAVEAAISTAESILTRELNQEDRQRLNDQFISRVNAHKNLRGNA